MEPKRRLPLVHLGSQLLDLAAPEIDAREVATLLATRTTEQGITTVVFDRGGYIYHGVVKALADSARGAGLKF